MAEAVFLVDIDAGNEAILEALTTQEGIRSWWTTDAAVTGDALDLGFPDTPARFSLTVDGVSEDEVGWTSSGEFPPHWQGTNIKWQIMSPPEGAGSQLFFTHGGFAEPDPLLGHTAYTWATLLGHLKSYLETGEKAPFFG